MKKMMIALVFVSTACATAPKPAPAAADTTKTTAPAPAAKTETTADAKPTATDDLDALLKGMAIHFEFDKSDLTADSQKRLDLLADKMRSNPKAKLRVAGNSDEVGTTEYNLALGQKRADAVKVYLGHLGVEPSRIETVSYGEEKPLGDDHAQNRRDDIEKKKD